MIYQEVQSFYPARNEFWFCDLVAFETFAKNEPHRQLVTRIVLLYKSEVLGRLSTRESATVSARAANDLDFHSRTICSKYYIGKLKVHRDGCLRKLGNDREHSSDQVPQIFKAMSTSRNCS